jgi:hypothetical protein
MNECRATSLPAISQASPLGERWFEPKSHGTPGAGAIMPQKAAVRRVFAMEDRIRDGDVVHCSVTVLGQPIERTHSREVGTRAERCS